MFIIFWRISKRSQKREIPLGDLGVFMFRFMFSYRYIARCPLPGTCVDEIFVFLPFSSSFSSFRFIIFSSNHGGACRAGRHMLKRKKKKKRKKREKNKRNKRETKETKREKQRKKKTQRESSCHQSVMFCDRLSCTAQLQEFLLGWQKDGVAVRR